MALKRMTHLCRVHLNELFHTPIFYAYLCLFFVYYHHLNAQTVLLQQEVGLRVNAWGYTAGVFSNYQSTIVFGLGAVMLFSDLPLIRDNALFESTRCSRNVWVGGRVMYIACVSVIYTLFMALMCLLTCRGQLHDPQRWGKLLNTLASGYGIGSYAIPVELSLTVTGLMTPLQALGLTLLMGALSTMLVGLCVLVLSLSLGRMMSLLGASALAVLDFLIVLKMPFVWYRFSPLSFTRLTIICNADMPYYPTAAQALTTLLISIAACVLLAAGLAHRHKHFSNKMLQEQY